MSEEYTPDLVQLTDDEGKQYDFEVLDAVEVNSNNYVALTPVEDTDELDTSALVIMKEIEEDGELYYLDIEDDEEYESIADVFINRLEDFYEIDEI